MAVLVELPQKQQYHDLCGLEADEGLTFIEV